MNKFSNGFNAFSFKLIINFLLEQLIWFYSESLHPKKYDQSWLDESTSVNGLKHDAILDVYRVQASRYSVIGGVYYANKYVCISYYAMRDAHIHFATCLETSPRQEDIIWHNDGDSV